MTSVLVLNAGSSSLKFAVIDPHNGKRFLTGTAERLGTSTASIRADARGNDVLHLDGDDHAAAVRAIVAAVDRLPAGSRPTAVGHRVVHGGERFDESVVLDDDVRGGIDEVSALAPLHNPPALAGIDQARLAWPYLPQVVVFDTSFHHSIPAHAHRYAVTREWYEEHRIRRYGFHGISVRYVADKAASLLGAPIDQLAMVVAHLGNGCSATAIRGGVSVETTMGLTPLEGLVMGTRSGDIDPAVFGYLRDVADMGEHEVTEALNKASGLLGMSGVSNDLRAVRAAADRGNADATLAIDVFNYRLAKAIASLVVSLERLDVLVFTGGIGEHDALVRASVVEHLGFLGLTVDAGANAIHGGDSRGRVSESRRPAVLVVPTDEELMIALDTARLTGVVA
jgi:acetate kinase